jgi:hypothetical protein
VNAELTADRFEVKGRRLHVRYERFTPDTRNDKARWWGTVKWKGRRLLTYRTSYGGALNLVNRRRPAR